MVAMKRLLLILACILFGMECMAQIKSFSAAKPIVKEEGKKITFDSTRNYVWKDVEELLWQELYVIPKPEHRQKNGYMYFYKTYKASGDDFSYIQAYEPLAGKTFLVDSILQRPYPYRDYDPNRIWNNYPVLRLREKNESTIYYYLYDPTSPKLSPFIIMGFHEKEKTRCIGKKLVIKKNKNPWAGYYEEDKFPIHDVITGMQVEIDPENVWTIKELVIDQAHGELGYMVTNEKDEHLVIDLQDINDYQRLTGPCVLRYDENLESIHKKQPEMYKRIMDGKIALGMTKDMVLMSWGNPENRNSASFGDTWMYPSGQFLFFTNEKLTSFQ